MGSTNAKDTCNYCMATVGRQKLQSCSQCRLVRYCSRDCQKAAWKTHKRICSSKLRDALANDADSEALNKDLSKWINQWKQGITSWSIWGLDMSRHGPDGLAKRVFYLKIKRRWEAKAPAQLFSLDEGCIQTREEVVQRMIAADTPDENVKEWYQDVRGNNTVQIVIEADGFMRFLWFSMHDYAERIAKPPTEVSDAMARCWPAYLTVAIDKGNTDAHNNFIADLILDQELHLPIEDRSRMRAIEH